MNVKKKRERKRKEQNGENGEGEKRVHEEREEKRRSEEGRAEKTKRNYGLAAVDDLGGEGRGSRPGSGMLDLLSLLSPFPSTLLLSISSLASSFPLFLCSVGIADGGVYNDKGQG